MVRAAGRARVTVGATDVGRRDIGSSAPTVAGAGGTGATGVPTPMSTGAGVGVAGAAVGDAGCAGGAAGAAEVIGTVQTTCGSGGEAAAEVGAVAATGAGTGSTWGGGAGCGADSSIPTACLTRSIRPTWAGSGTGSGAGGSGSGWAMTTRSPVHSRNFPHDPQKVSLSSLWCPHCLQTITRLSPPQHPVLSIVRQAALCASRAPACRPRPARRAGRH